MVVCDTNFLLREKRMGTLPIRTNNQLCFLVASEPIPERNLASFPEGKLLSTSFDVIIILV